MKDLNDIFERLNQILKPSLDELRAVQIRMGIDMQRRIITRMSKAKTHQRLSGIKKMESYFFERFPSLELHYRLSQARIRLIEKMKRESWKINLN